MPAELNSDIWRRPSDSQESYISFLSAETAQSYQKYLVTDAGFCRNLRHLESGARTRCAFAQRCFGSGSGLTMPFRLLNPAAAQCADTAVAQRRRSSVTTALQRSRGNTVVQCEGTTRAGRRCAVTAKTDFRDGAGRLVAETLRQGSGLCLFHLDLFCTVPVSAPDDFIVFFRDLETSGLDVLHDEVDGECREEPEQRRARAARFLVVVVVSAHGPIFCGA